MSPLDPAQDGGLGPVDPDDASGRDDRWHREFLAGWWDGIRAVRAELLNAARPELARFQLEVSSELDVRIVDDAHLPSFENDPIAAPDNPDGHPAYEKGWDLGSAQMRETVLERLREQTDAFELFVTDKGNVTTLDATRRLVDTFREHSRDHDASAVTDQALHDFLDRAARTAASAVEAPEPPPPLESPEPAPAPSFWTRLVGGLAMVRNHMDRRTAMVALGTALAAGAFGWRLGGHDDTHVTQPPQYSPPSTWSHLPPAEEQTYLAIDQALWQCEAVGNQAGAIALAMSIFSVAGQDHAKRKWATVLADSNRAYSIGSMLTCVDPAVSNDVTRMTVLASVERIVLASGPQAVGPAERATLKSLGVSAAERHEGVQRLIQRILRTL